MADSVPDEGSGSPHLLSPTEETQSPAETESETKVEAESETKAEAESETKIEAESETKAEVETESETKTESEPESKGKGKVGLLLKAAGDAPIMKQKLWMVDPNKQVTWVIQFIRRYIRLAPEESLFLYVSQAFSPAPDQTIGNLLQCFGSEGKLVLHYCKTQAWG